MTKEILSALASKDINLSDETELPDLKNIEINRSAPINKRFDEFIFKVKNPYLFKVGDLTVKIKMNENGKDFKTALINSIFPN